MADQLFEEWQVYEKLLVHDYMDHRAFFDRLRDEIATRFRHPLAILDLGCGDATPILPLLGQIPLRRYLGIDESDVALGHAERNLAALDLPARLIRGDLVDSLANLDDSFDVIVASYSMHHLADAADKQRALAAGRRVLAPGGLFAMIDVFCHDEEPRAHYLQRWIVNAENRYLECGPEERRILFDHVRARDFPVSLGALQRLGSDAGLARFRVLLEDQVGLNRLVVLSTA